MSTETTAETTTCAACATMTAEEIADAGWGCGSCGDTFAHDEGVHDVQYGIYHEFTCYDCLAAERAATEV
jgi:ribosomal protein L37AE/L43A